MGQIMKSVHIDKNGFISDDTPDGIKAWLEKYDQMISNGATKEEARKTANLVQAEMDKVCSNGYVIIDE